MTDKFQLIMSMTEEEIRQATIAYRLKVLISRAGEQGITQARAFNMLAKGMTEDQFNNVVVGLVNSGLVIRSKPERTNKTPVLTINPTFKSINLRDAPEE